MLVQLNRPHLRRLNTSKVCIQGKEATDDKLNGAKWSWTTLWYQCKTNVMWLVDPCLRFLFNQCTFKRSKLTLFNSHLASQWLLEHFKFLRISKRHVSGKQFKDSSCSVFDVEDAVDGFFDVDVEVDFATSTPNSISLFTIARIWSLSSFVSRELTQTKASILIKAKLEYDLQPVL